MKGSEEDLGEALYGFVLAKFMEKTANECRGSEAKYVEVRKSL